MTAMVPTLINGRWQLLLPEHRAARPEWPYWEAQRLAAMHSVITELVATWVGDGQNGPAPIVLDVGAEEGDFPGLWASWGANVILAEPNPRVWPNIAAIFAANDLPTPLATFAGFCGEEVRDVDGGLAVAGWPTSAAGPVIGDHGFCQLNERPDLPSITVDELAQRVGEPSVITMDVEGSELHVLRGAWQTIRGTWSDGPRPHVFVSIHPEFMADQYGIAGGVTEIRSLMHRAGYDDDHHELLAIDHEHHWWFRP